MITEEKIIKNELGLVKLGNTLGNVSQARKLVNARIKSTGLLRSGDGIFRNSLYRFKEFCGQGGEFALQEIRGKKPYIKNRPEQHIKKAVIEFAIGKPACATQNP